MDHRHFPHLNQRVRAIHAAMKHMSLFQPPMIRFMSDEAMQQTVRVLKQAFRKPLITRAQGWAERLIVQHVEAYSLLSQYIELKVGGQHWTSWGMLVHPLDQLEPDVANVLLGNIGPCLLRIDLSANPQPFQGLLENMKLKKKQTDAIRFERGVA